MTDTSKLPGVIQAAWGLRDRPTRGPKPALSVDRVVAAAVAVAASEGFAAVTMSRVATEVGTSVMSLYRYVANRDELTVLMLESAAADPPAPRTAEETWRQALSRWAWSQLAMFRTHLWITSVPIAGPPATPNQLTWMETGLSALAGTGLTEGEKLSVILLVSGFVRNDATLNGQIYAATLAAGTNPEVMMGEYRAMLDALVTAERFPMLRQVIDDGVLNEADHPDTEFVFGLTRILDGIEALLNQRS